MRRLLAVVAVAAMALASPGAAEASPISFEFSNIVGGSIDFDGSRNFSFANAPSGYSFDVTGVSGALTSALEGALGTITGTYAIGTITTVAGLSTAAVTGTGTFNLFDATNQALSFTVSWLDIFQGGTTNSLNLLGNLNLSGATYAGTDPNFLTLLSATNSSATISYTFNPIVSLQQLATSVHSTSYSGTFAADVTQVPEPASLTLLGSGLLSTIAMVRRRRKNAKK